MTFCIRSGTTANRDALIAFHHALYVEHRNALVPQEIQVLGAYRELPLVLREDVDSLLRGPGTVVLLGERDGEAIGYATGRIHDEPRRVLRPRGVVEDWYVDPSARGHGYGRALLDALLDTFRTRGCKVAESRTWPTNETALRAHQSAGFHPVEVMMRRRLDLE